LANPIRFSGRLTAIFTLAGVAIGLGNVWRFPYMMGQNGGSAFLLLYLLMMLMFAIPALSAEWALARHARQGTIGSFKLAFGSRLGLLLGVGLVLGIMMANSYYMVIIGNILYASAYSVGVGFSDQSAPRYFELLEDVNMQAGFAALVLIWGLAVIDRGLNRGIELISKLFVPMFGLVMIYLVIQAMTLDGAVDHLLEFLRPDFSRIGVREVFAAMGQACFSLGIGGTLMLVYGSYLDDDERLIPKAMITGASDAGAALLAALFIVPTVLVFGLDLESGPPLVFNTLPQLFSVMPLGRLVGSLFLVALTLMAFLSAVAGLQVTVRGANHLWGGRLSRSQIVLLVGVVQVILMAPSAFHPEIIGTLDLIFGSGFLVFGSAMAVIGLAWRFGPEVGREQLRVGMAYIHWLRWAVPAVLLVVLGLYIRDSLQA
jgi:NSS family neurotransmitter:Na+ symporter